MKETVELWECMVRLADNTFWNGIVMAVQESAHMNTARALSFASAGKVPQTCEAAGRANELNEILAMVRDAPEKLKAAELREAQRRE